MQSALADMAEAEGITWYGEQSHGKEKSDQYIELGRVFNDRLIEIPPDPYLRRDLISVRKHITQDNTPQFVLTKTPDGRHCDYVPAFARALKYAPEPALDGSEKAKRSQEDEMWDELIEAGRKRSDDGVLAAMERL
jgi:PAS domain-containing protein